MLKWRFYPSIPQAKIFIRHPWHTICNYTPNEKSYLKKETTVQENNDYKKCTENVEL